MRISTYQSLLTGKKTWLVLSTGSHSRNTYREAIIFYKNNRFWYQLRMPELSTERPLNQNLKSVINIVEGCLRAKIAA